MAKIYFYGFLFAIIIGNLNCQSKSELSDFGTNDKPFEQQKDSCFFCCSELNDQFARAIQDEPKVLLSKYFINLDTAFLNVDEDEVLDSVFCVCTDSIEFQVSRYKDVFNLDYICLTAKNIKIIKNIEIGKTSRLDFLNVAGIDSCRKSKVYSFEPMSSFCSSDYYFKNNILDQIIFKTNVLHEIRSCK